MTITQYPPQSEWILGLQMRDDALKELWQKGHRSGLARRKATGEVSEILGVEYALSMWWVQLNSGGISYDVFMAEWERGESDDLIPPA